MQREAVGILLFILYYIQHSLFEHTCVFENFKIHDQSFVFLLFLFSALWMLFNMPMYTIHSRCSLFGLLLCEFLSRQTSIVLHVFYFPDILYEVSSQTMIWWIYFYFSIQGIRI